jgi:transposase
MKIIRKKYTDEFKLEAAALVLEHGYSYSDAGRSLDVNPSLLTKWCKKLSNEGVVSKKSDLLHQKLLALELENRRLRMEREILKKAAAFFAKESI